MKSSAKKQKRTTHKIKLDEDDKENDGDQHYKVLPHLNN